MTTFDWWPQGRYAMKSFSWVDVRRWRGNAHVTAFAKARWGKPSPLEREGYHVAEAWLMCQGITRDETELFSYQY